MTINKHIVSIVFNRVEGDSRVIKTGQAALNAGYDATIVGVTSMRDVERKEIDGVKVVLLPNYSSTLKKMGLWQDGNKDLRLLIGGYLHYAIPEIIALKPDLLHSHDMIGLKIGGVVHKAMLAGGRIVPWIHDLHEFVAGLKGDLAESYMPVCLGWEREFLNVADHLVTVSDALAAEIQERYNVPYLPTVIYNTPKAGSFTNSGADIKSKIGLAKEVPLIVFVGGANRLRGCETILEAVARLDGVHLVFVSEGKYVSELTEKAPSFGIGERFHVHPYVPSDQVATFIRTADIGIHGLVHYPNAEVAMPNKMFEYLHAGLPIAVSDVHSMKVFVEMHGIGLPFVAEDAVSCSDTIRMLLDNQSSFRRRITVDLKRQYSWENQEEKIHLIYNRLIEAKHITLTDEKRERAAVWEKMEVVMFESIYARALTEAVCKAKNLAAPKQAATQLVKASVNQAAVLRKSGDLTGADMLLQRVLEENPEHLGALTQWAEVSSTRKEWGSAITRWERVMAVCEAGGLATPKQAAARLKAARLAQAGVFRKFGYYMRQFLHFARNYGWKSAIC